MNICGVPPCALDVVAVVAEPLKADHVLHRQPDHAGHRVAARSARARRSSGALTPTPPGRVKSSADERLLAPPRLHVVHLLRTSRRERATRRGCPAPPARPDPSRGSDRHDERRQAMRDHESGAAEHQLVERIEDDGFGLRIDRGRGLVENQDRRVLQERARDADALAFASRRRTPRSPISVW